MFEPSDHRRRRRGRLRWVLLLALVLIVGVAGGGYLILKARTGDISHPNVEFGGGGAKATAVDPFSWPLYGYTPEHLRYINAPIAPPFKTAWVFNAKGLLEFPPVIDRGILYQLNDNAVVNAVDKTSGKLRWTQRIGLLSASTPAAGKGAVYATVLKREGAGGRIAALSMTDGHVLWERNLPSGSESSPMLANGIVYFGSQDGTVYALRATDGSVVWTYKAAGSVKGSPTLSNGRLYFGDYGGKVHAISAATGQPIWTSSTSGALLGAGTFYSTAAVAFGRVYIGNTDGRMYSFTADTGELAWAHQTGNYIYSSAAVVDNPTLGPTVYVGSYDGTFYALNARLGDVRWSYDAGGKISGSPTIVGRVVYFADLKHYTTIGLNIVTGHKVFQYNQGAFDPVISDSKRIYLSGYHTLSALDPAPRPAVQASTAP